MRVQLARFLKNLPAETVAKYNTILNFSIFFCSSIILSLILALIFEKKIEEKQLSISENLLALEYIDEWNQYINMTDLYAFSWEARYLAEANYLGDKELLDENIYFLKECGLFPFWDYLPDIYEAALTDINLIGFSLIDEKNSDKILNKIAATNKTIFGLIENPEIKINEFSEIIKTLHSDSYKHKLAINNLLANKVEKLQVKNIISREQINHYNSLTSNIVLVSFLIQVIIYIIYNIFEVNTYSRNEK